MPPRKNVTHMYLQGVQPEESGPQLRTHLVNLRAENPWAAR